MIDYPYIIFYLILLILAYQYWKTKDLRIAKWSIAIAFIFFVFRAPVVGADTWNYVRYLTGERNFYNNDTRDLEVGFVMYREIISHLTSSRFLVMLITYTLSFYPLCQIVKKYSSNIPLSILIFCYLGCLSVYFVGMRQILGVALLVYALYYSLDDTNKKRNKILLFGGTIIISYLFHTICVFYALVYVVALFLPIKSRYAYIGLILGSASLGFLFEITDVQTLFSFYLSYDIGLTERLDDYFLSDTLNDANTLNILIRQSLVALFIFIFMDEEKMSHPFCKNYLAGIIIYNLFYTVPMTHRIIPPLVMFGAVCITWMFDNEKYLCVLKFKKTVDIVCLLLLLYFTRSEIINNSNCDLNSDARMHPYYFFFQDYMDHPSVTKF